MVELCFLVKRCGRVNPGQNRAGSRPTKDAVVSAVEIVIAEDEDEIVGVDAMNSAGVVGTMVNETAHQEVSRGRSIGRSREE